MCISIPVNKDFKVTALELSNEINRRKESGLPELKGLILSSPSNPTGAMLSPKELKDLCELCKEKNILFLSDEIYHGISYKTQKEASALQYSDSCIAINSFSKYYSMTGWRLGWIVVPDQLIDTMNRLTQNMYINAPTLSQIAACEAFSCEEELEENVRKYAINRKIVLDTLEEIGLKEHTSPPDGAFYIYINLAAFGVNNSPDLCKKYLWRKIKI